MLHKKFELSIELVAHATGQNDLSLGGKLRFELASGWKKPGRAGVGTGLLDRREPILTDLCLFKLLNQA